ncbi:hypothetical protein [Legionella gresilensis]|uniref:hypothetical protein n=1 Tax=Legionella gresilensis TaxID=91823 RepID=UPI0013EF6852|nr:hypothetical protein [Legionella gresilensis]
MSPSKAISYLENKMKEKVNIRFKNDLILMTLLASYTTLIWAKHSSNKSEISLNADYLTEYNCEDKVDKYVSNSYLFSPDIHYSDAECQKMLDGIKDNLLANLFYKISGGTAFFYSFARCLKDLSYLWNESLDYEGLTLGQLLSPSEIEEFKALYKEAKVDDSSSPVCIGLEEVINPQMGIKNIINILKALIPNMHQGRKVIGKEESSNEATLSAYKNRC